MARQIDFWTLLRMTQEYVSSHYAAVLTDKAKLSQLKAYVDKYLRDKNTTIINDKANRSEVWEYHQNDNFWGLGSSHLYEKPKSDPEHEENAIKKELKRLGLRV